MELWNKCSEKLENTLSQEDFNTWIRPLKAKIDKNTLELVAPNDFILDYIEKNYSKEIKKIVKTQSKSNINLVFKTLTKETFIDKYKNNQNSEIKLVDGYTFDSFVEGKSNHRALAAAKQVAANPKGDYNPLFIYGKPGVGKTHLLKTIDDSSESSFYIDSESFLESYISGIKNKDIDSFKKKIRSVDILLIDDIQFFVGKKGVSEELFHTINFFLNNAKSVVLASDQKPQNLSGFPDRLVSRILNGLVTDITKPDKEIFSEVLKKSNIEFDGLLYSKNEFEMLLSLDFQSFREINGVINNLIINKQTGVSNNKYLSDLVSLYSNNKVVELSPEFILKYCSEVYQVDERLVLSKNRSELVSNARHLFVYLMRKHTEYSLNQIGLYAGNRSHSTVLSSIKKVESSNLFKKEVNIFNNKLEDSSLKFVGV